MNFFFSLESLIGSWFWAKGPTNNSLWHVKTRL